MKTSKKGHLFWIAVLAAVMVLGFVGCDNVNSPTNGNGNDDEQITNTNNVAAQTFKTDHADALDLDVGTIGTNDEAIVKAALDAYNALDPAVKTLLADEKALLDSLKEKIDEIKADSTEDELATMFKDANDPALFLTVETVNVDDEAIVDAALNAYVVLDEAVQALLADEKDLLDSLKAKIDEIKADAEAFKSAHAGALALTVGTVTTGNEAIVNVALNAYALLGDEVKALLSDEKDLLDSLKDKIDEIKQDAANQTAASTFKTTHSAALALTVASVSTANEAIVNAALAAYEVLDEDVQELLTDEKALLDNLKAKIDGEKVADGSQANPFIVDSVETLQKVGTGGADGWTLSAHYKQTKDIDLVTVTNWTPIGSSTYAFYGIYDGDGYTVLNLTIDATAGYQGLFGFVNTGGVIKDVTLVNCNITSTGNYVGGVVGYNYNGTVSNSYATGNVSGTERVGGVAGYNEGTVTDCYASGNVNGSYYVGGVVGWNSEGTVTDCSATSNVSGTGLVGGVVGYNNGGTVENSYATGTVSGSYTVGGVVGYNYNAAVTNSYATGHVEGGENVGGVVGNNYKDSTVTNSYATSTVLGTENVGGVVGSNYNATVTNSYATGDVEGDSYVGGVAGFNDGVSTVTNSYATSTVSGTDNVGGVAGYTYGIVSNSVALNGSISGSSSYGRVAANYYETLTNNYARSNMTVNGSTVSSNDANSRDGEDITSEEWSNSSWWTETVKWDTSVWNFSATNLPTLKNVGGTQTPTVQQ